MVKYYSKWWPINAMDWNRTTFAQFYQNNFIYFSGWYLHGPLFRKWIKDDAYNRQNYEKNLNHNFTANVSPSVIHKAFDHTRLVLHIVHRNNAQTNTNG